MTDVTPQENSRRVCVVVMFTVSILFSVCLLVGITLAFDAWVAEAWGSEYTVSWVVLKASHSYPAIPFLFGSIVFGGLFFLAGHLFASQHGDNPPS